MNHGGLRTILAFSVLSLTACAQQSELHQIQHEIKSLNQDMLALSQQAVTLSRQNELNAHSTQGVYLLPNAGAPALLESQIGVLKMSLAAISPVEGGTQVTLFIQESRLQQLPAFSAIIEWRSGTDKDQAGSETANGQQSFTVPVHLANPDQASVPLILPGITPETLRWVRIHHITPITDTTPPPVR